MNTQNTSSNTVNVHINVDSLRSSIFTCSISLSGEAALSLAEDELFKLIYGSLHKLLCDLDNKAFIEQPLPADF